MELHCLEAEVIHNQFLMNLLDFHEISLNSNNSLEFYPPSSIEFLRKEILFILFFLFSKAFI